MTNSEKKSLYQYSPEELKEALLSLGFKGFKTREVLKWIYEKKVVSLEKMTTLSQDERGTLGESFQISPLTVKKDRGAQDGTAKFLYELKDGRYVESVLIPSSGRLTLCISSQVGCPVGCTFCASGILGLRRNLEVEEMVGQFVESSRRAPAPITNLVVMGMGEPFINFDKVMKALQIINHPEGPNLGIRRITLSTVGIKNFMEKIFTAPLHPRLAISLHAPTDELRKELIPYPHIMTIEEILEFLHSYTAQKLSRVTLEYVLLKDKNSSSAHARLLGKLFKKIPIRINLIPYNQVEGLPHLEPSGGDVDIFLQTLSSAGVKATVRGQHGDAISAACGQLRLQEEKKDKKMGSLVDPSTDPIK